MADQAELVGEPRFRATGKAASAAVSPVRVALSPRFRIPRGDGCVHSRAGRLNDTLPEDHYHMLSNYFAWCNWVRFQKILRA